MRSHVFPVCKPGSRTFAQSRKKDGGKSTQQVSILYSETEDPDIIFSEVISNNSYLSQIGFMSKDKSEYLIDLTEAPETDLTVTDGTESIILLLHNQSEDAFVPPKLWEDINGRAIEKESPTPGQVVCVGRKKSSAAAWSDFSYIPFYFLSGGLLSDKNRDLFLDTNVGFLSNKFDNTEINGGEWVTYMWTGERFVVLGSNNWY